MRVGSPGTGDSWTHTEFTDLEVEPPWRDWRVLRHAFNFFGFIVHNAPTDARRGSHRTRAETDSMTSFDERVA